MRGLGLWFDMLSPFKLIGSENSTEKIKIFNEKYLSSPYEVYTVYPHAITTEFDPRQKPELESICIINGNSLIFQD